MEELNVRHFLLSLLILMIAFQTKGAALKTNYLGQVWDFTNGIITVGISMGGLTITNILTTNDLSGMFYPLVANPSNYIPSSVTNGFASKSTTNRVEGLAETLTAGRDLVGGTISNGTLTRVNLQNTQTITFNDGSEVYENGDDLHLSSLSGEIVFDTGPSISGLRITSVGTPSVGTDAANKDYVDTAISGVSTSIPVLTSLPSTFKTFNFTNGLLKFIN